MKLKNKAKIEEWLADGELELVLEDLIPQLKASKSGSEHLKIAVSLSAQLEKLKQEKMKGIVTYEQETVAFNKLQTKVQEFVEAIEKDKPSKPVAPTSKSPTPPQPGPITTPEKNNNWVWAIAFVVVAFGIWWMLFRNNDQVQATIRICTRDNFTSQNWCANDISRLSIIEAVLHHPMVTAAFEGQGEADPLVTGTVYLANGDVFATKKIQLTMTENGLGYAAELIPAVGAKWEPSVYIIKLQYNGAEAGEKQFEVFNDRQFLQ